MSANFRNYAAGPRGVPMMAALLLATWGSQTGAETAAPAAEGASKWFQYQSKHSGTCAGPLTGFDEPERYEFQARKYVFNGYQINVENPDADKKAVLGVVSTTKDADPNTIYNLRTFVGIWKKAGAEAVIYGGDLGTSEEALMRVLYTLGEPGWPVYVIIGNNDSRGSFNSGLRRLSKKWPNIINLDFVRIVNGDDYTLVSLPGYYDKRFKATTAGCEYKPENIAECEELAKQAKSPVILISHGPPKMEGPQGIDVATEAGNVGDLAITDLIRVAKIPFGIFPHINEAGGKAVDLAGKHIVKPEVWSESFYLNPSQASGLGWVMANGARNVGMAATVEIDAKRARYRLHTISPAEHENHKIDEWSLEKDFAVLEGI